MSDTPTAPIEILRCLNPGCTGVTPCISCWQFLLGLVFRAVSEMPNTDEIFSETGVGITEVQAGVFYRKLTEELAGLQGHVRAAIREAEEAAKVTAAMPPPEVSAVPTPAASIDTPITPAVALVAEDIAPSGVISSTEDDASEEETPKKFRKGEKKEKTDKMKMSAVNGTDIKTEFTP